MRFFRPRSREATAGPNSEQRGVSRIIASIFTEQIEQLATGDFVRRGDNLVVVGQSGVGKSHLVQAVGRQCCVLGYHVRYTTSADLLRDLTAALADQSLPTRLKYWTRVELLIIDEFGFERLERTLSPQAANLMYKVIDGRSPRRSTSLVTNIDSKIWADYPAARLPLLRLRLGWQSTRPLGRRPSTLPPGGRRPPLPRHRNAGSKATNRLSIPTIDSPRNRLTGHLIAGKLVPFSAGIGNVGYECLPLRGWPRARTKHTTRGAADRRSGAALDFRANPETGMRETTKSGQNATD